MSDGRGEPQTPGALQFGLEVEQPVMVLCAGTSAPSAVRGLSLRWLPTIMKGWHLMHYGQEYGRELAQRVKTPGLVNYQYRPETAIEKRPSWRQSSSLTLTDAEAATPTKFDQIPPV